VPLARRRLQKQKNERETALTTELRNAQNEIIRLRYYALANEITVPASNNGADDGGCPVA